MREFLFERSNLTQSAILAAATLAAVILLGLVLAYWTWIWFAPSAEPRAEPAPAPGISLASARTLFGAAPPRQAASVPAGIAIKLLGVAAATGNRNGYAVVQFDAKQILAVEEGEDIAPGIRLAEVHSDHVILERGGVRETLAWPRRQTTAAPGARTVNQ